MLLVLEEITKRLDPRTVWWQWRPESASNWDRAYRWFNLSEAGVWFLLAALVAIRWYHNRRTSGELCYAATFALFGLTDLREAWMQSPPLVLLKGTVLAALWALRQRSKRRWYPGSRFY